MTYEVISHTRNDGLLTLKKVNFCVKRSHRERVMTAVCDIAFVNRKKEMVPPGYVSIGFVLSSWGDQRAELLFWFGELNSMLVVVQYGGIPGALLKPVSKSKNPTTWQKQSETATDNVEEDPTCEPYSIFKPFFYFAPPPLENEGVNIADKEGLRVNEEHRLFSRHACSDGNNDSLPLDKFDHCDNTFSLLSITEEPRSIRPVSTASVAGVVELPFELENEVIGLPSFESILKASKLDLLYIPTPENVELEVKISSFKLFLTVFCEV
eukprot:m.74913 g.74913  ORF g.74913 m.74913 type:complete len:267 (+) comp35923_c0_seq2:587-1387(+)